KIGAKFRQAVASFAEANHVTWVRFAKDDRKAEVMAPYLRRAAGTGRSQVAAIGGSQEFQRGWTPCRRETKTAAPQFTFAKADRRVTCYYFLWVPKTCASWADGPTERGRFGQALGVGRAGLGLAGGGMIFGLWA